MAPRLFIPLIALIVLVAPMAVTAQPAGCRFVLGFNDVRELIGRDIVGECREDERPNQAGGDTHQITTQGLMVWRRASNTTAFSNGHETWILGPEGFQRRLNSERFAWEPDAASFPRPGGATTAAPAAAPARPPAAPPAPAPAAPKPSGSPAPVAPVASPVPAPAAPVGSPAPVASPVPARVVTPTPVPIDDEDVVPDEEDFPEDGDFPDDEIVPDDEDVPEDDDEPDDADDPDASTSPRPLSRVAAGPAPPGVAQQP